MALAEIYLTLVLTYIAKHMKPVIPSSYLVSGGTSLCSGPQGSAPSGGGRSGGRRCGLPYVRSCGSISAGVRHAPHDPPRDSVRIRIAAWREEGGWISLL